MLNETAIDLIIDDTIKKIKEILPSEVVFKSRTEKGFMALYDSIDSLIFEFLFIKIVENKIEMDFNISLLFTMENQDKKFINKKLFRESIEKNSNNDFLSIDYKESTNKNIYYTITQNLNDYTIYHLDFYNRLNKSFSTATAMQPFSFLIDETKLITLSFDLINRKHCLELTVLKETLTDFESKTLSSILCHISKFAEESNLKLVQKRDSLIIYILSKKEQLVTIDSTGVIVKTLAKINKG